MFMGEYNHTIDGKGRVIVPAKFRDALGDGFVVTKGLDGCLFVYSEAEKKLFPAESVQGKRNCRPGDDRIYHVHYQLSGADYVQCQPSEIRRGFVCRSYDHCKLCQ